MVDPTMTSESQLLSQCMGLVHDWLRLNQKAYLNIKIGNDFEFEFSNQERSGYNGTKRISPSRRLRNEQRKLSYDQSKHCASIKNDENISSFVNRKGEMVDNEAQSDIKKETFDREIQAEVASKDNCTNTENVEVTTLEDNLNIAEDGSILPLHGEALVEMRVNHDYKS